MINNFPEDKTLLEKLIEASTFGLDDLELNRQGRMSGLQRSRLGLMAIIYFGACIVLFSFAVGAAWVLFTKSQFVPIPAMLVWMILCMSGSINWLLEGWPVWKDFQAGTILCVSGPLHQIYVQFGGRHRISSLRYMIAEKVFDIVFFAPKFIPQDQNCNAYYTPRSEIIIGLEPI